MGNKMAPVSACGPDVNLLNACDLSGCHISHLQSGSVCVEPVRHKRDTMLSYASCSVQQHIRGQSEHARDLLGYLALSSENKAALLGINMCFLGPSVKPVGTIHHVLYQNCSTSLYQEHPHHCSGTARQLISSVQQKL